MRRRLGIPLLLALAALGCGGQRTVQFGAVLPLTGEAQIYGQSIQKGVEMAFAEVQGRQTDGATLTLSVVDSQTDARRAAELAEQLYSDGALAVIGGVTTAEALAMVPVADRNDRVLLSPSASNPELTGISKYFYRVFISDAREGATMATFATQRHKVPTVVILAKTDPYARGVQQIFKQEFERQGGQVLDLVEFPPDSSDFAGLVDRVMTLEPAAVYLAAYAEDVAGLIRALRAQRYGGHIYTTSAFASPNIIARVGAGADGVFLTQAVFDTGSEDPMIAGFVQRFRDKYGAAPDLYAAHGYDSVMVLDAALRTGQADVPSEFWRSLRSLRDFTGVTGTIQFDERGDVQKFPRVYVVDGGDLIDYEAEVEARRQALLDRLRELERRRREGGE